MKEDDICTCSNALNSMCLQRPEFILSIQMESKPEEEKLPEETDEDYDGNAEEYEVFKFTQSRL